MWRRTDHTDGSETHAWFYVGGEKVFQITDEGKCKVPSFYGLAFYMFVMQSRRITLNSPLVIPQKHTVSCPVTRNNLETVWGLSRTPKCRCSGFHFGQKRIGNRCFRSGHSHL